MELSIDTASEMASVALSREGRLAAEITWISRRNHTTELLPTIERLLGQAGAAKDDLTAVFVCTGPGMYTGLRVGISVAKGLAYALRLPAAGVGRLELDAYPHAAFPGQIIAVHRAGRGELAWAAYQGGPWREISPPRLATPEELAAAVDGETLIVGETDEKLQALLRERPEVRFASPAASVRRAGTLAELGFAHLRAGLSEDPALLLPVYLRPPAVTTRKSGA